MRDKKIIKKIESDEEVCTNIKRVCVFLGAFILIGSANANPVLNNVAAGNITVQQTPGVTTINQASQQGIINWQSFNIGATEATHFNQPTGGITLNRISPSQGASQIFGQLTATGTIILINQAGIYFGPSSHVDVGGIIASTTNMTDQNFLAGNYAFDQPSAYSGSVINQGRIIAAQHGLVALVGSSVSNTGLIKANLGSVVLASGATFTVDLVGDQLINFAVNSAATSAGVDQNGNAMTSGVSNSGKVIANGGQVLMTAQAAQGVLDNAINMTGVVQANSVSQQNGEIILSGGDQGTVNVSGKLSASGKGSGQRGGTVEVLGNNINVQSPTTIDVSGDSGGGTILIGGNFHGAGPQQNASTTYVAAGVTLNANAITNGNGGQIAVWSNDATGFFGNITAQGGAQSGNGGYVETSSANYLDVGAAQINLSAPNGTTGTWLLDPYDVTISTAADTNTSWLSGGTYTPQQEASNINTTTLDTDLATASIIITTNAASTADNAGNITVENQITWSSNNSLTLQANNSNNEGAGYGSITINSNGTSPMINATGAGNLTLNASQGNIAINGGITLAGGTLTLTAQTGSLASPSITTANEVLSSGAVTSMGGAINVGTFDLTNGTWSQVQATTSTAALPTFSATNFELSSPGGTTVQFVRAVNSSTTSIGTSSNPYLVTDVYGLQGIGSSSTLLGDYFSLANNIDASGTANWNNGAGFIPIGNGADPFTGTFNGNYNAIENLTINNSALAYVGLFGYVGNGTSTGEIENLTLDNPTITNQYSSATAFVGAIAGEVQAPTSSTIILSNDSVSGGSISSDATYSGSNALGGLVGEVHTGEIYSSYNGATVTDSAGVANAGGIVGYASSATLLDVYNTGAITANIGASAVGGLVGQAVGTSAITNAYNSGQIILTPGTDAGALVGYVGGGTTTVTSAYWDTSATGIGTSGSTIGAVGLGSLTAGATGYSGESTANMMSAATFSGWNIGSTVSTGTTTPNDIWFLFSGATRPMLISELGAVDTTLSTANITNAHQLQLAGTTLGASYTLTNNINLASAMANISDVWATNDTLAGVGSGFVPIGGYATSTTAAPFTGTFNGNNFTISNLYEDVTTPQLVTYNSQTNAYAVGLFGFMTGATISNLGVVNENLIAGVSGTAASFVGGLAGAMNTGGISNSYTTGTISTANNPELLYVGGVIGWLSGGTISDSYSTANLTITSNNIQGGFNGIEAGGFAGYVNGGSINTSYSAGSLMVNAQSGSGAGANTDTFLGGFVGDVSDTTANAITNDFSITSVTSTNNNMKSFVGGFSGDIAGSSTAISNSYATGAVSSSTTNSTNVVAGFTGSIEATGGVSGDLWDVITTGQTAGYGGLTSGGTVTNLLGGCFGSQCGAGIAVTNATNTNTGVAGGAYDLSTITPYTTAGWSISDTMSGTNVPNNTWVIFNGQTRPLPISLLAPAGTTVTPGTTTFTIYTPYQLQLAGAVLDANYILANNINLTSSMTNAADIWGTNTGTSTGAGFVPIGGTNSPHFTGSFNGENFTISNLYINSTASNVGLFGEVSGSSVIQNVGLQNSNIQSTGGDVGALAGSLDSGSVTNDYSSGGTINGGNAVGGLIGWSTGITSDDYTNAGSVYSSAGVVGGLIGAVSSGGVLSNSYSSASVTLINGEDTIGGLVGSSYQATITNSYATGSVNGGTAYIGGLVGYNYDATITNSYSTGKVTSTGSVVGGFVGYNNGGNIGSAANTNGDLWDALTSGQTAGYGATSGGNIYSLYGGCFGNTSCVATLTNATNTAGTLVNLATMSAYTTAGWSTTAGTSGSITDVASTTAAAPNYSWFIFNGDTRPLLLADWSTTISTPYQLQLAGAVLGANYTLAGNINLADTSTSGGTTGIAASDIWGGAAGQGFVPIGGSYSGSAFTGSLNGNDYTISNLNINNTNSSNLDIGLFGAVGGTAIDTTTPSTYTGVIENLILSDATINSTVNTSSESAIGTLLGVLVGTGAIPNYLNNITISGGSVSFTNSGSGTATVGGLAGNVNGGTITNSSNSATVMGSSGDSVGGITGEGNGVLYIGDMNSGNIGSLTEASIRAGGISGYIRHGMSGTTDIITSYNTGSVSGGAASEVGGLVGDGIMYILTQDYNTGNVAAVSGEVGGLIGFVANAVSLTATGVYNLGAVSLTTGSSSYAGGLIGDVNSNAAVLISNSYNAGSINGGTGTSNILGGLVGMTGTGQVNSVTNSYNVGAVSGATASTYVGGLIGKTAGSTDTIVTSYNSGAVSALAGFGGAIVGDAAATTSTTATNVYYDSTIDGGLTANGAGTLSGTASGLTTTQFLTGSNFSGWSIGSAVGTTWYQVAGSTRPILESEYSTNITNDYQLQLINLNLSANYTLANTISAANTANTDTSDVWAGNTFSPLGTYLGTFNGNYNAIENLSITNNSLTNVGLFSVVGNGTSTGQIANLTLDNPTIINEKNGTVNIGAIAGEAQGASSSSIVLSNDSVSGGSVTTDSTTTNDIGGLVGELNTGEISSSYNGATVSSNIGIANAGGIVGFGTSATLLNVYNTGAVTANTNTSDVGGLIGQTAGTSAITDSYNSGQITLMPGTDAGALVGQVASGTTTVMSSYWDVSATGVGTSGSTTGAVGVGTLTAGTVGYLGESTANLMIASTFAGWNISSTPTSGMITPNDIWYIFPGETRPMLISELGAKNSAISTTNTADTIINAHQLQLAGSTLGANYQLANNINLASALTNLSDVWGTNDALAGVGSGFAPIGNSTTQYTGIFNGNNYTISNLYENVTTSIGRGVGLFGDVSTGTIENLNVANETINVGSSNVPVGGLIGYLSGAGVVTNDSVAGTISLINNPTGYFFIGGLIGELNGGAVSNSSATEVINATSNDITSNAGLVMGGLVGYAPAGSLTTSYSAGSITVNAIGTSGTPQLFVGGAVGQIGGTTNINNDFSIASLTVTSSGNMANNIGGFVGIDGSTTAIADSYSTGLITTSITTSSNNYVGGFVGYIQSYPAVLLDDIWDVGTSGQAKGFGFNQNGGMTDVNNLYGGCFGNTCASSTISNASNAGTNTGLNLATIGAYTTAGWSTTAGASGSISDTVSTTSTAPNYTWFIFNGQTRPMLMSEYSTTITTPYQLQLAGAVLGASYTLGNNINLTSGMTNAADIWGTGTISGVATGAGFVPIGNSTNNFSGIFNGENNTISGLYENVTSVTADPEVGFFGDVSTGTVENVNLTGENIISGISSNVGGLVGYLSSTGLITNDSTAGTISLVNNPSTLAIGGLVGLDYGVLENSDSNMAINITDTNLNTLNGMIVGGAVGYSGITGAVITNDYSGGSITLNIVGTGGNKQLFVGGFIGSDGGQAKVNNDFSTTSVNVTVSGTTNSEIGGFVGYMGNSAFALSDSYSSGLVTTSGATNTGGFAGATNSSTTLLTNDVWDIVSSGQSAGVGTGVSASWATLYGGCFSGSCGTYTISNAENVGTSSAVNLSNSATYSTLGWNITSTPSTGASAPGDTWFIFSGSTRPLLLADWSTTVSTPYQLQLMGAALDANYTLAGNINLANTSTTAGNTAAASDIWGGSAGQGFVPIGNGSNASNIFTGSLNGEGYTISNLNINSTASYVGLFGDVGAANASASSTYTGEIQNLILSDPIINAAGGDIGAVAGYIQGATNNTVVMNDISVIGGTVTSTGNSGGVIGAADVATISNIYNSAAVTGSSDVGGIVGASGNDNNDYILNLYNVYNSGNVTGGSDTGGITGVLHWGGLIANSYNTGIVQGSAGNSAGGLVGQTEGFSNSILNSYNTGAVSTSGGSGNVGGLVGWAWSGGPLKITDSYNSGAISVGANGYGGGLVGTLWNDGLTVLNSYNSGAVNSSSTTNSYVGGILGKSDSTGGFAGHTSATTITNSYNVGSVSGGTAAGGFIGEVLGSSNESASATITTSYNSGQVSGATTNGALIGVVGATDSTATATDSFWDYQTTGIGSSGSATGLAGSGSVTNTGSLGESTNWFLNPTNFTSAGWSATTWYQINGSTRPILTSEYTTNITNDYQLQLINLNLSGNYTLGSNVAAANTEAANIADIWAGLGFSPIGGTSGATAFTGNFNGNNDTISNLNISTTVANPVAGPTANFYIGLFGYVGSSSYAGEIQNFTLSDPTLTTTAGTLTGAVSYYQGAVAGLIQEASSSDIAMNNVTVTGGTITGAGGQTNLSGASGGLIGDLAEGTVTNLTNSATVTNTNNGIGGIAGTAGTAGTAIINLSTNSGTTASGAAYAAGILGLAQTNLVEILNSHNTGAASSGFVAGGILAYDIDAGGVTISNSYSTSTVVGNVDAGGLIGAINSGEGAVNISDSYNTNSVTSTVKAGGLVGLADSNLNITNSYNAGSVTGNTAASFAGGLVGNIGAGTVSILNAYNLGSVSATGSGSYAGGLIGSTSSTTTITNAFSAGDLSAPTTAQVGGIIGDINAGTTTLNGAFWDVSTSNLGTDSTQNNVFGTNTGTLTAGGLSSYAGYNTANMQSTSTSGSTPYAVFNAAAPGVWGIAAGMYPYLKNFYETAPTVVSGIFTGASGSTVQLVDNGVAIATNGASSALGTTTTGANGYYYFLEGNGVLANSSDALAYIVNGTQNVVGAITSGGSNSLGTAGSGLTVASSITSNSGVAAAVGTTLTATGGILYSASGNNLSLLNTTGFDTAGAYTINGTITPASGALGAVTFGGATTLANAVSLNAGTNNITFDSTLNGPFAFASTGAGSVIFDGLVGQNAALASISVAGGTTINTADISTTNANGGTGNQTYSGAAILDTSTTLTSTGGLVDFGSTLNDTTAAGEQSLTITGNSEFDGIVGGTLALGGLSVSGTSAINTSAINTADTNGGTGNQTYTGAVTLDATSTLSSVGGEIDLASTVNGGTGPYGLTLTTTTSTGSVVLGGVVGSTNSLASFTINNAGTGADGNLTISNNINTTGNIAITMGQNIALSAGSVNSSTGNVSLTGGGTVTESGGTISGGLLTTSSVGGTTLNDANAVSSFNATNTTSGNIALTNTAAPLTITGISQSGNGTTTINNTGAITTSGVISTSGTGLIDLIASGAETIGANITATSGPANITLNSGGIVNQTAGTISGGLLTTDSVGGTTLNDANAVSSFNATNATSGNIGLTNTGSLNVTGVSEAGGSGGNDVVIANTGALSVTGTAQATGGTNGISLTASGASGSIAESGSGLISGGLLTTNSVTGETLNGANTVSSFNATNSTSGNIALTNTAAPLTITGVSQSGNGTTTINNTGAMTTSGVISTSGTGLIDLIASGAETIGANITATGGPANITLNSGGIVSQTAGVISGGLLTTDSVGGTTLSDANAVSSFNATNTTSGNIALTNTAAPLTITGISQSGNGTTTINNTGAITTSGVISTSGTGLIDLIASGAETIGANITATGGPANITLNSGGIVSQTAGVISGGLLTTDSVGGTTLNDANAVSSFNATNATSGNIGLTNTGSLNVTGVSEAGGSGGNDVVIANTGALSVTGTAQATGGTNGISLTASGASGSITESGSGLINGGLLTTNSVTGETLNGANTISSFNATNSTSGSIALTNTAAPLTITGISQSGNGTTTINNTGAITTSGVISTSGTGLIDLIASGAETIGANITATSGPANITLNSGGIVNQTAGTISGGLLTTDSVGGTTLNDANAVSSFNATNATSGNIGLTNTGSLNVTGVSETGGSGGNDVVIANTGALSVTGTAQATGGTNGIALTASGASGSITESGSGLINGGLLTTNSVTGETLNGANTVSSFNATNSTSGNIALTNTAAPLTITGVSQSGNGTTTINNTGAMTTSGVISTSGTGLIDLIASGAETIGANITATGGPANITLNSGGIVSQSAGVISGGLLTTDSVGGTTLNGANTVTGFTATNTGSGDIDLTNTTSTLDVGNVSQGSGAVNIINTGAMTVDDTSGDQITTNGGDVNLTTLAATNPLTVNGNIITSGGNIDLNAANNDPTNSGYSALVVNSVLNTSTGGAGTPGTLTFGGGAALNGSPNLGGTGQGGNITLQGNGSDITLGTVSFTSAVGFAAVQDITINGAVTTTNGAGLTLTADVNNTGTGGVDIASGGSLNIAGALTINGSSIDGTGPAIDIESSAGTISAASISLSSGTSNGAIDINHALTATGAGGITANAGTGNVNLAAGLSSAGAVNFDSAVVVSNTPTINAGSNAVNFNSGVTGSTLGLQNTGGTVSFNGDVGLTGLTTAANAFNVAFNGATNTVTDATTFNNTGDTTFASGTNTTFTNGLTNTAGTTDLAGNVNATNTGITLDTVSLTGAGTLNSGSGVISLGTIGGSGSLTSTSSTGTTLNGAVNAGSLTLSGGGTDTIATSTVTTTGSQTYNDNVALSNDAVFTSSGNGAITLANGASGAGENLTLAGGTGSNTFNLAGTYGVNNLAVTGGSAGNNNINLTGSFSGNDLTASGGSAGNNNINLTGSFGVNSLNVTGGGNTNNTLAVQAANTIWNVTGANSGTVGGVTGMGTNNVNFNQVQNLTANSSNISNTFTLQGGTLSGSITGGGNNNTLTANSGTNVWNITGVNSGNVTGVGGNFTNIQDLYAGATGDNTFNVAANGSVSGGLYGSAGGTNTLSLAGTAAANFTSQNGGSISGVVGSFSNIENIQGNGQGSLQLPSLASNTVHITGYGQGYFNDPTTFSGFSNMVGQNNAAVVFDTPVTQLGANTFLVNGQVMQFSGVNNFSGQIIVPTPNNAISGAVNNTIISAVWPGDNTIISANNTSDTENAAVLQVIGGSVSSNIQSITQQQNQLDTILNNITVNLNCDNWVDRMVAP